MKEYSPLEVMQIHLQQTAQLNTKEEVELVKVQATEVSARIRRKQIEQLWMTKTTAYPSLLIQLSASETPDEGRRGESHPSINHVVV